MRGGTHANPYARINHATEQSSNNPHRLLPAGELSRIPQPALKHPQSHVYNKSGLQQIDQKQKQNAISSGTLQQPILCHDQNSTSAAHDRSNTVSTTDASAIKQPYLPPNINSLFVVTGSSPENFTNAKLQEMPVLFSFELNSKSSLETARKKNKRWQSSSLGQKVAKKTGVIEREVPSDEFPAGWVVQYIRRSDRNRVDRYWFSPKTRKRFRSKVGVNLFLATLPTVGDDEDKAFIAIKPNIR